MRLTVLGSGTCGSDLGKNNPTRFPPGFWVEWSDGNILFDLGEGIRFNLEKIGVKYPEVKHIAISHIHADHYTLPQYLQAVFCHGIFGGIKTEELNIYAPNQIVDTWPILFKIFVPAAPAPDVHAYEDSYLWPKLNWHKMSGSKEVKIGNAALKSESVYHELGKCDAVAFRLEAEGKIFVYSGDTGICEGINKISKDADVFICEASARVGGSEASTKYGHLTPFEAGEIAKQSNVKKLVLTHYCGCDSDGLIIEDCKKSGFGGEIIIAKDFQVLEI